jgi:hypothetical protein
MFIIFDMEESKVATIFHEVPCHESAWKSGIIAPYILNHGARWRWLVNLMPQGKSSQYPLDG